MADKSEAPKASEKFSSRAGYKLDHALSEFKIDVRDMVCLDVGASTGGFTDCLLKRGARLVYAVDVGYGILDWKLRCDKRVVVMERTNIRYVESLPEKPNFASVDVSFISLKLVLPVVNKLIANPADIVALVKPQFEVRRDEVARGGVVKDEAARLRAIDEIKKAGEALGWECMGQTDSPIAGAKKGNIEHLVWFHSKS